MNKNRRRLVPRPAPASIGICAAEECGGVDRKKPYQPRLLILDEPTEGIQPSIVQKIEAVIEPLKGELSILLVAQIYDFAAAVADQHVVRLRGQEVPQGLGRDMAQHKVHDLMAL